MQKNKGKLVKYADFAQQYPIDKKINTPFNELKLEVQILNL